MKTAETVMGTFTVGKYKRLQAAYDRAVEQNQAEFEFDNTTYLTSFAKYVLEYLAQTFENGIEKRSAVPG